MNMFDRHPRRYINMQILWIVSYLAILFSGLLRLARGTNAGDLALGLVGGIAGLIGVAASFLGVNAAMKRLEAKSASDSKPDEIERSSISSLVDTQ